MFLFILDSPAEIPNSADSFTCKVRTKNFLVCITIINVETDLTEEKHRKIKKNKVYILCMHSMKNINDILHFLRVGDKGRDWYKLWSL